VPLRLWFRGTSQQNPFAGRRKPQRSSLRKHIEGRRG
jgi:hypothetical protein